MIRSKQGDREQGHDAVIGCSDISFTWHTRFNEKFSSLQTILVPAPDRPHKLKLVWIRASNREDEMTQFLDCRLMFIAHATCPPRKSTNGRALFILVPRTFTIIWVLSCALKRLVLAICLLNSVHEVNLSQGPVPACELLFNVPRPLFTRLVRDVFLRQYSQTLPANYEGCFLLFI